MKPPAIRYLVLWLTTRCNLRCAYCYRPVEAPSTMSRATARAALDQAASSGKRFHVQLAGGEPTLEPDLIEYVGALVRSAEWPASIALQTNGTRLDARLIEICLRYRIEVGISLDGPLEIQQWIRGGARDTYRGLGLLDTAGIPARVTTVLCAENVGHLAHLAMSLASFSNVRGFGLDPLVLTGASRGRRELMPDGTAIEQATKELCRTLTLLNQRRKEPLRWRELDTVRSVLTGRKGSTPYCHAACGESLAVHPSGAVYPCSQTVGEPGLTAGTLDALDWVKLAAAFEGVRMPCHDPGCVLAGRCPGDCPSRLRFNRSGAIPSMCHLYRAIAQNLSAERSAAPAPMSAPIDLPVCDSH